MYPQIAVIQADVANIKEKVAELQKGMKDANVAIAQLQVGQATLQGSVDTLRQELKAIISRVESSLIKWIIGMAITAASAAFTFAKLIQ